ncbi:MAG: NAD(P)-dependent alcohol dehydrogenase [Planctomycetes bacterium]|nr:NAD(P)-dependent alcohol dehydrogenase [Planctomycetota bacterium]
MKALVLEKVSLLSLRQIELDERLGPRDVRIKIHTVGICGSDVEYYRHGRIGPFVVEQPMVVGHEASGTVIELGSQVKHLAVGDRVCMEPGVPDPHSMAARLGMYNLDPSVRFWATPPIHGCLRETVVHPEEFTFKLPNNVSFAEGAMIEPLAIGMHAATKAALAPGDLAVVLGAGTIGAVTTLAALAGGCSRVIVTDVKQSKLDLLAKLGPITPVNVGKERVADVVADMTGGWGADVVFECSGSPAAIAAVFEPLRPGGRVVLVGMPGGPSPLDIVAAQVKEACISTIFRYAHVFDRALALIGSGKIDVKPLITDKFAFEDSIRAFEWALDMPDSSVKAEIEMPV